MTAYLTKNEIQQKGVTALEDILSQYYPEFNTATSHGREAAQVDVEKYAGRIFLQAYQRMEQADVRDKLRNALLKAYAPITSAEKDATELENQESRGVGEQDLSRFKQHRNGGLISAIVGEFQKKLIAQEKVVKKEESPLPRLVLTGDEGFHIANRIIALLQEEAQRDSKEYLKELNEHKFADGRNISYNEGRGGGIVGF
jgi:hypothetical protein